MPASCVTWTHKSYSTGTDVQSSTNSSLASQSLPSSSSTSDYSCNGTTRSSHIFLQALFSPDQPLLPSLRSSNAAPYTKSGTGGNRGLVSTLVLPGMRTLRSTRYAILSSSLCPCRRFGDCNSNWRRSCPWPRCSCWDGSWFSQA